MSCCRYPLYCSLSRALILAAWMESASGATLGDSTGVYSRCCSCNSCGEACELLRAINRGVQYHACSDCNLPHQRPLNSLYSRGRLAAKGARVMPCGNTGKNSFHSQFAVTPKGLMARHVSPPISRCTCCPIQGLKEGARGGNCVSSPGMADEGRGCCCVNRDWYPRETGVAWD